MIHHMPKKDKKLTTSCGALAWRYVNERVEVLLIKQFAHKDRWGVPKGHAHEGESYEACALREVKEETGLDIELLEPLPDVQANYKKESKTVKTWFARVKGDDVPRIDDPDSEVADARWFPIDRLPTIVSYQRRLLEHACAGFVSKQE